MSEMQRQRDRIDHIVHKTGKAPNVLDVNACEFDRLVDECRDERRYSSALLHKTMELGFELFGVRFVKGRV